MEKTIDEAETLEKSDFTGFEVVMEKEEEVVGPNFTELWISLDQDVNYDPMIQRYIFREILEEARNL